MAEIYDHRVRPALTENHLKTSLNSSSTFMEIWLGVRRSPSGLIGLCLVTLHLTLALLSPALIPYDPDAFDTTAIRAAPSAKHFFGTDRLGRDIFTRTLLGGRVALFVTIIGTALAISWGGLLGITLGYWGGWLDEIVMRLLDAIMALPRLLILLLIASLFGTDAYILILALGFLYGMSVVRIARSSTLGFVTQEFITAARSVGATDWRIIRHQLLPNVLDILLVEGTLRWSWMLLSFSALSFLGFGVPPPTPDWGLMIATNRDILSLAPWATFFPIIAVSSLIIGVNLLADTLVKVIGLDRRT